MCAQKKSVCVGRSQLCSCGVSGPLMVQWSSGLFPAFSSCTGAVVVELTGSELCFQLHWLLNKLLDPFLLIARVTAFHLELLYTAGEALWSSDLFRLD